MNTPFHPTTLGVVYLISVMNLRTYTNTMRNVRTHHQSVIAQRRSAATTIEDRRALVCAVVLVAPVLICPPEEFRGVRAQRLVLCPMPPRIFRRKRTRLRFS